MKKSLIALTVLGAIAGAAQAQSSVTIYGTVDAGVTYSNNNVPAGNVDANSRLGGSKFGVGSGNIDTSRIGFKGVEDLGGGLKALFQLEAGFNTDTGGFEQDKSLFNRKSVVGLGGNFGSVLLGRQSDVLDDYGHQYTSVKDFGNFVGSPHVGDRLEGSRTQNSIRYNSPSFSGVTASAIYGFGEEAGANSNGQAFGGGVAYDNGPLGAYLGYYQSKAGKNSADTAPLFQLNTVKEGDTMNKTFSLGASYQAGPARLYGNWSRINVPEQYKQNIFELGTDYALSAPLHLLASVQHTQYSLDGNTEGNSSKPQVTQVNLGVDYYLSKRTDLYTLASYAKGKNGAPVGDYANPAVQNDAGKSNQTAVAVGIRHKF
ncbi:outer membrane insertion C-terminal signal domain protein [Collimonas fungivorans]|uniref:Outer membrane insertion C-terminal signal domain protein n=1 Tax=Collimonas fungivorans TaxID=158899 RepID=A0A127PI45_9BURK|nr:porin [Collimonas fungivorans]AMO97496.1 outer membrane insertion C-terminal signal domain protein [Collimonas fungivorans]